tara:strand:- start:6975 stop:8678 length:1704 start_codon:yes stop_codon:yes gene_type:complete
MAESYMQYIDELAGQVDGEDRTDLLRQVLARLAQGPSDFMAAASDDVSPQTVLGFRPEGMMVGRLDPELIEREEVGLPLSAYPDVQAAGVPILSQIPVGVPLDALPDVAGEPPLRMATDVVFDDGTPLTERNVGRLQAGPADPDAQAAFAGNLTGEESDPLVGVNPEMLSPAYLNALAAGLLPAPDTGRAAGEKAFDALVSAPFGAEGSDDRTSDQVAADARRETAAAFRELKEAGVDFNTAEAQALLGEKLVSEGAQAEAEARAGAKPAAVAAGGVAQPSVTTENVARKVVESGAMTTPATREVEELLTRRAGIELDQQQRQDRLDLSRLLELQAVRQLQKAENTRGQPRSLMDLYRGDYDKRGAADAAQRINAARAYFNRAGNIRRELMNEEESRRKTAYQRAKEKRLREQLEVRKKRNAERKAKRLADDKYRYDKLDFDKLKLETLTPYQKAVIAARRDEEGGRNSRAIDAMAARARGSWDSALRDIAQEVRLLKQQKQSAQMTLAGEVITSNRVRMQKIIDGIDADIEEAEGRHKTIRDAVDTYAGKTTGVKKRKRRPLEELE